MSKVIGIPVNRVGENSVGASINYIVFIQEILGCIPRIIFPEETLVPVDLLMLPGGPDLAPQSYGAIPSFRTGQSDMFKQFFFDERLDAYIENNVPIFGICLGFQMLMAKFGVPLVQHFYLHAQSKERWKEGHKVKILDNNPFGNMDLVANANIEHGVNSHHHQGVLKSAVQNRNEINNEDDQLIVVAEATCEDWKNEKIVEAFAHSTKPIAGTQFHGEELYDAVSINLIQSLLNL